MTGRPNTADVVCTPDEDNRDYVRLWIQPKDGAPMVFRLSLGAAEMLAAELVGSVGKARAA